MYLRVENDNADAKERRAAVERQIEDLGRQLISEQTPDNARKTLDLAAIHCWRGNFRQTANLLQPLVEADLPADLMLEARQMIADNHFRHDQYDIANQVYRENLEIAQREGHEYWATRAKDGIAWVLIDVGHYTSGEFEEAGKLFAESLPVHKKTGTWVAEAMGLYGLSRSAAGMGDYERAISLAHCSMELLEENGGHHLFQLPLLQLANVYRDCGNFERAKPFYDRAVDAADRSQDPYLQALTAYHHGCLLLFINQPDEAQRVWNLVLPTIDELDFPRLGSETCGRLARLAADRGEYESAYRMQIESQVYGNRVGVISSVLQNQQMLLRESMDQTVRLEDELRHLTAGIEASEDGIFVVGEPDNFRAENDFLIRFVNQAGAKMLGRTPIAIAHVLMSSVWRNESAAKLVEPSLEVYRTGERRTLDPIELEFMTGKPRWYAVKIARISDGLAWTVSDVTERETMRQEILAHRDTLEEANQRLIALDQEKSEVLGIAAHDLRSPIGNIRALCELISSQDPETAKLTGMMAHCADSLLALIENLLDVERIEQGRLDMEIGKVDVSAIFEQVIDQFSAESGPKRIEVVHSGAKFIALADESAVVRVAQNLLSNAIKFSPPGSFVLVRTSISGGRGRVVIQDQGPGISDTDRKKLFVKFARLSARPTAGESTAGLGLAIVKRLVEAMDGEVGCDSSPGHGAAFWVELPTIV